MISSKSFSIHAKKVVVISLPASLAIEFYSNLQVWNLVSLKCFTFSSICNPVSQVKVKGYSFEWVMTVLLSMPFIDATTVHSMLTGCVKHQIHRKNPFVEIVLIA